MDDRTERLGSSPRRHRRCGLSVPSGQCRMTRNREKWQQRAAAVASYREMFGYDDPSEPIGPEPVNSPDARPHWHAAFAALGPVDDVDLPRPLTAPAQQAEPMRRRLRGRPAGSVTTCARSESAQNCRAGCRTGRCPG